MIFVQKIYKCFILYSFITIFYVMMTVKNNDCQLCKKRFTWLHRLTLNFFFFIKHKFAQKCFSIPSFLPAFIYLEIIYIPLVTPLEISQK